MENKIKVLVTGGSGFIGTCLIKNLIKDDKYLVFNVDKNRPIIEKKENYEKNRFIPCDITEAKLINNIVLEIRPDFIINLAAETHVDRSIDSPDIFVKNNVLGTLNLLEATRNLYQEMPSKWKNKFIFYHAGTDEVYGSGIDNEYFNENSRYNPSSPYSASKAASNFLVQSWFNTYKLPIVIGNCSNNYGPAQFPEKLIPLVIYKALNDQKIPLYGDGKATRDWIYVEDHVKAILRIIESGKPGSSYCIGGNNLQTNIEIVKDICKILDEKLNPNISFKNLITYVEDRPGHDKRYALDTKKLNLDLKWEAEYSYKNALEYTVEWYIKNQKWCEQKLSTANYHGQRLGLIK